MPACKDKRYLPAVDTGVRNLRHSYYQSAETYSDREKIFIRYEKDIDI